MLRKNMTFLEAAQVLFEEADLPVPMGEHHVRTRREYRYPHEEPPRDKSQVYQYLQTRKISPQTADHLDIRQDAEGNMVLNYYDTNDVLTMVKYRPSRKVGRLPNGKKENKCWCQKDADTTPLLFNMNRCDPTMPLVICEGELDCAAVIESGYMNVVSVPLGANNYGWIEQNWDWLEQFSKIIVCADNDEAGEKMQKEIIFRLGSWRTLLVDVPHEICAEDKKHTVKDMNEVLYYGGKEAVRDLIVNARDCPVNGVIDFSDIQDIDLDQMDGIKTGFRQLDRYLMKLFYGTFNILTGVNGCVSADTEYFNGTSWKYIADYTPGESVLQYNEDGSATLVQPLQYHKYPCDHFYHLKSSYGVDQVVSEEHNIVYVTTKGNLAKRQASDFVQLHNRTKNGFHANFITDFRYDGEGIPLSDDEIRVMCAVIAEGYFPDCKRSVPRCRINIKKPRKIERMREIL